MINKHKSNKIKENSNTVRHLNNGTDHHHSKSCCDQSSPARRTITMTSIGSRSNFELTKDTPYITLMGNIQSVFIEYFEENNHDKRCNIIFLFFRYQLLPLCQNCGIVEGDWSWEEKHIWWLLLKTNEGEWTGVWKQNYRTNLLFYSSFIYWQIFLIILPCSVQNFRRTH